MFFKHRASFLPQIKHLKLKPGPGIIRSFKAFYKKKIIGNINPQEGMKNECFNDTTGELKLKDSLTIISEAWVKFRKYDCQPLQPCKKMGCDYRDKCSW